LLCSEIEPLLESLQLLNSKVKNNKTSIFEYVFRLAIEDT